MMKQLKGGLPGQKVYQWDRLEEFKRFSKKINNQINEIEIDENESILSRESHSLQNSQDIYKSYYEKKKNEIKNVGQLFLKDLDNSQIKENKPAFDSNQDEILIFNNHLNKSKINFKKKESIDQIFTEEKQIVAHGSPISKYSNIRTSKIEHETERY